MGFFRASSDIRRAAIRHDHGRRRSKGGGRPPAALNWHGQDSSDLVLKRQHNSGQSGAFAGIPSHRSFARAITATCCGRPQRPNAFASSFWYRFRSRTPGPPPFSSMNSMPRATKACLIAWIATTDTWRRFFSKSTTVDNPNVAAAASSLCVSSNSARAALHWPGVMESTFFVDIEP
jgi:hypothetical protein